MGLRPVASGGIGPPNLFTPGDLFLVRRLGRSPLRVERDGYGAMCVELAELWPIVAGVADAAGPGAWIRRAPLHLGGAAPHGARA